MVRHTDIKTVLKEEADPHRSLEIRGMAWQAGPRGEAPGQEVKNEGKMLYCAIFLEERQGRVSGLRIGWCKYFNRLRDIKTVPDYLVPGPGVTKAGECWPGMLEPERWGQGGNVGSGLVSLQMERVLRLNISRNWLALERTVSPGSLRSQMSKH